MRDEGWRRRDGGMEEDEMERWRGGEMRWRDGATERYGLEYWIHLRLKNIWTEPLREMIKNKRQQ